MLMREAGAGGWQLWGSVTPVGARANSAVNIISHPRSGDKFPFDSILQGSPPNEDGLSRLKAATPLRDPWLRFG